ncbi:unnamed protein product, partial [Rotaria magnacalcarata]
MPTLKRNWCAHPCHLETSADGKKHLTKIGQTPNHPLGSRRMNSALLKYINATCLSILKDPSMMLNENHSLCRKCYEKEVIGFELTKHEGIYTDNQEILMYESSDDDGDNDVKDLSELIDVKRDYAIEKLNQVFELFQLGPVIPGNTVQTEEKIDKIYLILQDWLSHLTNKPKEIITTGKLSLLGLSISELEDFIYRFRRLFDKSNYDEQVLLMQTAPIEWGWKKIEKFFSGTCHQARSAILQRTGDSDLSKRVDGRGKKRFDFTTAQFIQDFYLDDEISRQSSYTKDTRKPKGIGTVVIRYMTMSIGETYELFKRKYPNLKVNRSKFHSLRPSWVREHTPHQVCMCIQHQNVELLLTAISKTLQYQLSASELVDKTVCTNPFENCYNCRCDNCCNTSVSSLFMTDADDIEEKPDATWSLWTTNNNHVKLQHFNGAFRSLIDQLNGRWPSFVTHTYVTRQQRDYIKSIKLASSFSTFAVVQMDFAENFSFVVQKEIQSAYWNKKQSSLYTVAITVGGDHRSMVIISNRMVHDTTFVFCTQKLIVKFLLDEYPTLPKINYVSDGAPSQFKNNYNMLNLALHQQDFAIKAAWTFTSSGHGKSPCDGLGAVVKSAARKYLLKQGPEAAFCSAKDFYQFALEKTSRIFCSTKPGLHSQTSNSVIDYIENESTDEETDLTTSRPTRSIEVRWLDEEEVEETF